MKNLLIPIIAIALAGCSSTKIKTGEWEVTSWSHWLKRDVDKLVVEKSGDGYKINVNGYKADASEQLPAFTREMWAGLGILGRIAAATVNPTAAAVPLTPEAANPNDIAAIQRELATAKTELAKIKAETEKAKAAAKAASAVNTTSADCEGEDCEY